jgi:hypothetical protein
MSKLELLPAGLIAAAMLTTQHHLNARHVATDAHAGAMPAPSYIYGNPCYPAPRVGAFATQPWDNDTPCEPMPGY